jgi:hypothetical protein
MHFHPESLNFTNINLEKYCTEQNIEVCAVKLNAKLLNICILATYRAPGGNFTKFLNELDSILRVLHSPNTELIICADININYLDDNTKRVQLLTFNLTSIISPLPESKRTLISY